MAKPLGSSDKNNRSQAHEINKWALRRQMSLKKSEKREIAYSWMVYDIEKREWATAGPK